MDKTIEFLKQEKRLCEIAPKMNGCGMTDEWIERIRICNLLINAVEKQIPKEPTEIVPSVKYRDCPDCGNIVAFNTRFCPHCGQALKWNDGLDTRK